MAVWFPGGGGPEDDDAAVRLEQQHEYMLGGCSSSREIITCGTCLRPALTIAMATGRQPCNCLVRAEVCFGLESQ